MSNDRRDNLDRWNEDHDRAVAWITCTREGRSKLLDIPILSFHDLGLPFERNGVTSIKWSVDCEVEKRLDNYSVADAVFTIYANRDPACRAIVEVKTGKVIAGEVIRQLRRYEHALSEAKGERYCPRTVLVIVHTKPLTTAASMLFTKTSIVSLNVGEDVSAFFSSSEPSKTSADDVARLALATTSMRIDEVEDSP